MKPNKLKFAKLFGSIYFIILALSYFLIDVFNNTFNWFDIVILLISCSPLLIKRSGFYIALGSFASLIWIYFGIAFIKFNVDASHADKLKPLWHYVGGYTFISISILCGLLLIYYGLYGNEKAEELTNA
jgi:hypothetical protein